MASLAQLSEMEVQSPAESAPQLSGWIKSLGERIATAASTCADYYAAAALYDQLCGLSDAQLKHRGLSRETLARDICETCDRAGSR
jgi:hypothetical protein